MKLNKLNPFHFIYALYLILEMLILCLIKLISNSNENKATIKIGFQSHNFNFNTKVFYELLRKYDEYEILFLTFNFLDYLNLRNQINCYFVANPFHLYKFLNSNFLIIGHGLHFHNLLRYIFGFYSIYINHGVFTSKIENLYKHYIDFDEIWHFSNFEKDQFKSMLKNTKQIVTGFPITQYFLESVSNKKFTENKILIAFSSPGTKKLKFNKFSINNIKFLKYLENFSKNNNISFLIRPHIDSKLSRKIQRFIKNSEYLEISLNNSIGHDDYQFLNTKLLVTDNSSIYVHYLLFQKPILFVSNSKEINKNANEFFNNQYISYIFDFNRLEKELTNLINNNFQTSEKLIHLKNNIYNNVQVNNIYSSCLNRLKHLINDIDS